LFVNTEKALASILVFLSEETGSGSVSPKAGKQSPQKFSSLIKKIFARPLKRILKIFTDFGARCDPSEEFIR